MRTKVLFIILIVILNLKVQALDLRKESIFHEINNEIELLNTHPDNQLIQELIFWNNLIPIESLDTKSRINKIYLSCRKVFSLIIHLNYLIYNYLANYKHFYKIQNFRKFSFISEDSNSYLFYKLQISFLPFTRQNSYIFTSIKGSINYLKDYLNKSLISNIILALFLLSIYISIQLREKSFIYYLLFVISSTALQFTILQEENFISYPTNKNQLYINDFYSGISTTFSIFFAILTTRSFLNIRQLLPSFNLAFALLATFVPVLEVIMLISNINDNHPIITLFKTSTILTLFVTGVITLQKRYRPAKFYMAAFTVLLAGFTIHYLKTKGLLPVNTLTENSLQISSAVEMVLMFLGFYNKVTLVQEAKSINQQQRHINLEDFLTPKDKIYVELEQNNKELKQEIEILKSNFLKMNNSPILDQNSIKYLTPIFQDLRTFTTSILESLEDLLTHFNKNDIFKNKLFLIKRNADKINNIINNSFDFKKLKASEIQLKVQKTDLVKFLKVIIRSFTELPSSKKVHFYFNPIETALITFIDNEIIHKVITNILTFNLNYIPEGGMITLDVSKVCINRSISDNCKYLNNLNEDDSIQITIEDTGIGIFSEKLKNIFNEFNGNNEFHCLAEVNNSIDFSQTKELIQLLGGKIVVQSELKKGTKFIITLPLIKEHLQGDYNKEKYVENHKGNGQTTNLPLLETVNSSFKESQNFDTEINHPAPLLIIIENNSDLRTYIRDILESTYRIIEGPDGNESLKIAVHTIPDLIICDLEMPQLNVLEFCNQLKSDERTNHIPIILLTGSGTEDGKIQGFQAGVDEYLIKPFYSFELKARVKNLIEGRQKLRERFSREIKLQPKEIYIKPVMEVVLQRAMSVVETHISEAGFSAEDFAHEMNMSRTQLHRKLKALTNLSTTEFIRILRLKRAAQLLEHHGGNVTEITFQVGFNNLSYFAKCFKDFYGVSPSEYGTMHSVEEYNINVSLGNRRKSTFKSQHY